jgi:acetoin utilization deacetylase AcuC-like enzyme
MLCREATAAEIEACHQPELVRAIEALSAAAAGSEGEPSSTTYFTQDTYVNASTFLCARLAAGGCIDVAAAVARCLQHYLRRFPLPWASGPPSY